jgi:hypothetical protein
MKFERSAHDFCSRCFSFDAFAKEFLYFLPLSTILKIWTQWEADD